VSRDLRHLSRRHRAVRGGVSTRSATTCARSSRACARPPRRRIPARRCSVNWFGNRPDLSSADATRGGRDFVNPRSPDDSERTSVLRSLEAQRRSVGLGEVGNYWNAHPSRWTSWRGSDRGRSRRSTSAGARASTNTAGSSSSRAVERRCSRWAAGWESTPATWSRTASTTAGSTTAGTA
jgi:hypothetical protein